MTLLWRWHLPKRKKGEIGRTSLSPRSVISRRRRRRRRKSTKIFLGLSRLVHISSIRERTQPQSSVRERGAYVTTYITEKDAIYLTCVRLCGRNAPDGLRNRMKTTWWRRWWSSMQRRGGTILGTIEGQWHIVHFGKLCQQPRARCRRVMRRASGRLASREGGLHCRSFSIS